MKLLLISCSIILILCGCSNHPSKLLTTASYPLFDLTATPKTIQNRVWLERFSINIFTENGEHVRRELLLQTEFTTTHINIVALSLEGLPLIQASWNSQFRDLKIEKLTDTTLTKEFDIMKIIHDLQAVHWPLTRIRTSLNNHYSVYEEILDNEKIRRFFYQNKVIMTIYKKENQTKLRYFDLDYEVNIFRLKDKPLKARL